MSGQTGKADASDPSPHGGDITQPVPTEPVNGHGKPMTLDQLLHARKNSTASHPTPTKDDGPVRPAKDKRGETAKPGGSDARDDVEQKRDGDSEQNPPTNNADHDHASPPKKKRRKVNHACVYCRRSHMTCDLERPCARCIKRDIGHLCHDEPREGTKRAKSEQDTTPADGKTADSGTTQLPEPFSTYDQNQERSNVGLSAAPGGPSPDTAPGATDVSRDARQHNPLPPPQPQDASSAIQSFQFGDWNAGTTPSQFHDMHHLHPNYGFNTSEITGEYNLLGDFLSSSLMDDGAFYTNDDVQALFNQSVLPGATFATANNVAQMPTQPAKTSMAPPQNTATNDAPSSNNNPSIDTKARDKFYMTAADPAGNDTAEQRMSKLLKAKYDAGMLRPFNYVKGYARLNRYMELNMRPLSRQKILRQLEKFRPKFREKMQALTDMQLVLVEMWFERTLMEYDRVFASMAIPACCWRRTGEIYRGNKEMAELIRVPIEDLRDVSRPDNNTAFVIRPAPLTLVCCTRVN